MQSISSHFRLEPGGASYGQLLNGADLIGSFDNFKPKFAKRYGNVGEIAIKAFSDYASDVRSGSFPDEDHVYKMRQEEADKLAKRLQK